MKAGSSSAGLQARISSKTASVPAEPHKVAVPRAVLDKRNC